MLAALNRLCTMKYSAVKGEVDIQGDLSDEILRKIAPTTNDVAVALVDLNVYQTRYQLLRLVEEGVVLRTGVSKGLPLHWWLISVGNNT
ncbi:FaeA-like protein [Budvicia aquatica]|uniref:FaeA-like protein n=1 Tax=Budvicia aquatica TaxID=82979 RepID=A0A484ZLB5_9GAMM|nr:FaeA-like protein [Budvicia aquatica]VFS49214.1 FaeA-like protein [Budvicia aquatica]VFS53093.1 FaeA-like protein [Budvicia aquatica]